MSAASEALAVARAAGVRVGLDGDALALAATAEPPAAVLALLSEHKAAIIALLQPTDSGWSAEDWRAYFEERAAIAEFDNELPRHDAEMRAFDCCVAEWLLRHPAQSDPGRCLWCGGADRPGAMVLPFGYAGSGRAWLHGDECWVSWCAHREAEAIAALKTMGIERLDGRA